MASILIRQFDVFTNPSGRSAQTFPYLVVLQSDWVTETSAVIVAPLVSSERVGGHPRLYPEFTVAGRRLALAVTDLAAIPRARLSRRAGTLRDERDRIVMALDLIFTGFLRKSHGRNRQPASGPQSQGSRRGRSGREEHRVQFGRTKAERKEQETLRLRGERHVEGHRLDDAKE